jgi:hypothetical protein
MARSESIQVFQNLTLRGPRVAREDLRRELIKLATGLWRHAPEPEAELSSHGIDADVMVFNRAATKGIPAGSLFLWGNEDGYSVTNIVPIDAGEIDHAEYNAILQDFADRLIHPLAGSLGYTCELSGATQSIDDWLLPEAAAALRHFSKTSNKATGSSHPSDRRRWFEFCILAHGQNSRLDTSQLVRWLVEIEGWEGIRANDLALEYEFARDLLSAYDARPSA